MRADAGGQPDPPRPLDLAPGAQQSQHPLRRLRSARSGPPGQRKPSRSPPTSRPGPRQYAPPGQLLQERSQLSSANWARAGDGRGHGQTTSVTPVPGNDGRGSGRCASVGRRPDQPDSGFRPSCPTRTRPRVDKNPGLEAVAEVSGPENKVQLPVGPEIETSNPRPETGHGRPCSTPTPFLPDEALPFEDRRHDSVPKSGCLPNRRASPRPGRIVSARSRAVAPQLTSVDQDGDVPRLDLRQPVRTRPACLI